jgi:hypothetical protein
MSVSPETRIRGFGVSVMVSRVKPSRKGFAYAMWFITSARGFGGGSFPYLDFISMTAV